MRAAVEGTVISGDPQSKTWIDPRKGSVQEGAYENNDRTRGCFDSDGLIHLLTRLGVAAEFMGSRDDRQGAIVFGIIDQTPVCIEHHWGIGKRFKRIEVGIGM